MNELLQAFLVDVLSKIIFAMENRQVPGQVGLCGIWSCYHLAVQPEAVRKLVVRLWLMSALVSPPQYQCNALFIQMFQTSYPRGSDNPTLLVVT